jgi:predicted TPR repeat methyltransferase
MLVDPPTLANVELEIGVWRRAHPQLDAHLTQGVEPARALRHLGLVAWGKGDAAFAVTVLKTAATLAPHDASIWADLSGAHYACAQKDEARACLLRSLEHNDRDSARWLFVARLHQEAGEEGDAEAAFSRALGLDPGLHDAWLGLGLLYFQQRRFPDAARALRRAIGQGSVNPTIHACLGEALYLQGDIQGAAEAYAAQKRIGLIDPAIAYKFAFIKFLEALINGPLDEALAAYHAIAGEPAEDDKALVQKAFHVLGGYGYRDAAVRCGRAGLADAPDDPVYRYLVTVLEGSPVDRAPDDYLIRHFDQFAEGFDHKLVDILDYRIPEKMWGLVRATGRDFSNCLDAGCGTGLAGPLLRAPGRVVTGVDLSSLMSAKAAERGVYDTLVKAEIVNFLADTTETFDLVFAADVLVYIGDLAPVMAGAAQRLDPGGLFAFSIETTEAADYTVLVSGRFAHRRAYVEEVARDFFTVEQCIATQIRLDAKGPVAGMMFILRRRE